ncbi:hypothetical protein [Helicobacter sp. MIT 14-3879]|uniref:hypothetical protein n=1 Tax=Helicobacter sp. MIT 14-3879 TaxID=2040649 RepID=UPI000E1F5B7E|nr:hypothetical protein [Helicobacter sp. MIT 14-3879]RDU62094.1 hypothetical protein CQA44_07630 [Helicobacter sp. MIT 14-3879]
MYKFFLFISLFICINAEELPTTTDNNTTTQVKDSIQINNDAINNEDSILPQNTSVSDFFTPAPIVDDTFASFVVGYQLLLKNNEKVKHGIFFAIDRGWSFIDNMLLLALSLDGSAGGFYAINLNLKLGGRFLDGRIIPNISFGYGLLNHFENGVQQNLHGANATISLFIDIIKGIGIEIGYRVGLHPFHTIKKTNITKNIQSVMLNLKFMDFDL